MAVTTYRNLDLVVSDYHAGDGSATFRVQVINSPAGEQFNAEEVALPDLGQRLRQLDKRALSLDQLIDFGMQLGSMLFPPSTRSFLDRSRERLQDDQVLRIRLRLNTYALANIPWEYVYVPPPDVPPDYRGTDGFLVLDRRISFVRYEVQGKAPGRLDPIGTGPLRMVTLLANPISTDYATLKLDVERQNIEKALQGVASIQPEFYPDTTLEVLQDALTTGAHVFHFAGHAKFEGDLGSTFGSAGGKGYLILLGPNQAPAQYAADNLAKRLTGSHVRLAFLGACEGGRRDQVNPWTGVVPALTRAGIPAVVGMQYTIRDDNAIAFSRRFYAALAQGKSIDDAVIDGRLAILEGSTDPNERDWGVPGLYLRAEEGTLFPSAGLPPIVPPPGNVDLRALRDAMIRAFSIEDLQLLCDDIQQDLRNTGIADTSVSLELVGGSSKPAMVLNLIMYLERRGHLAYLVSAVRRARPGIVF